MIELIDGEIVLSKERHSFADIYAAIGEPLVEKAGDGYEIRPSIRLTDKARLHDQNVSVTIHGQYFQIEKKCEVVLGQYKNNTASKGCFVSMPNAALAYGFGERTVRNDATQSGNLYLYNSSLKIPCFWGFFAGPNQRVEIIDCLITGFGRVEGTDSVVRNVIFDTANSTYGVLSPKGQLREYKDISVRHSYGAAMYFNPELADDMLVTGGVFENYSYLVYCEQLTHGRKTIRFKDADIRGNRTIKHGRNTTYEEAYTFCPQFLDSNGEPRSNVQVTIDNAQGEHVFVGESDVAGRVHAELVVCTDHDKDGITKHNPFHIKLHMDDAEDVEATVSVEKMIDAPFVILERTLIEYVESENDGSGTDSGDNADTSGDGSSNPISVPDGDAVDSVYVCSRSHYLNEIQKRRLMDYLGDDYVGMDVYTDITSSAYSRSYSYEQLILNAMAGKVKRLYVWEPEVFGPHRMKMAERMLSQAGVEVIQVRELL